MQSERKEALRQAQNRIVQAGCHQSGADYAKVNSELNSYVGVTRIRDCTEEQLQKRYQRAKEMFDG